MTEVGSVQVTVTLGLQRLLRDAAKAQQQLQQQLKDRNIAVGVTIDPQGKLQGAKGRFQAAGQEAGQAYQGGIEQGFKGIESKINSLLGGALKNIGTGIAQGVGIQITQTITGILQSGISAAVGSIQSSIGEFINLDEAIKSVGVISQSTGTPELEAFRKEVERLGVATSKSPAEIANMAVSLARAGFTAEEAKDALEGIVRASEATGESLEISGDIIAKTIRTFGLAASESSNVADLLVQTANSTNTSVAGLGESLKYLGPTAVASNQNLSDTLVLLGLLGDVGIQGGQAGTNLAQALERLKLASAGTTSEFPELLRGSKNMVAAFEKIGASVRNSDGSMQSLLTVLPDIQANLKTLSQADQDILMKSLFGVEGGRAFQALMNTAPDRLQLVADKMQEAGGVAAQAGEEMLQGLGGSLKLLEGSVQTLKAKLGEAFAPALEAATRAMVDVVNQQLEANGLFDDLTKQSEEFADYLKQNPEIVDELSQGLETLLRETFSGLASAAEEFTTFLKENPTAIEEAINAMGSFLGLLKDAVTQAAKLAGYVLDAAEGLGATSQEAVDPTSGQRVRLGAPAAGVRSSFQQQLQGLGLDRGQQQEALGEFDRQFVQTMNEPMNSFFNNSESAREQLAQQISQDLLPRIQEQAQAVKRDVEAFGRAQAAFETSPTAPGTGTTATTEVTGEAVEQVEQSYADQIAAIKAGEEAKILSAKEAQAAGRETEEATQAEIIRIQRDSIAQQVALIQTRLKAVEAGSEEEKGLQTDLAKLRSTDADLAIKGQQAIAAAQKRAAEEARKAQEDANREALRSFERTNQQAAMAVENSQNQRVAAVREAQLAGVVGEEEAQSRIEQIQQDGIAATIAAKEDEIARVNNLRAQGILTAEESADRESQLISEVGQLRLDQIEAEVEAQRAAREEIIRGIEEEFNARKSKLEGQTGQLDLQSGSLQAELDLLSAQSGLSNSLAGLEQERLNTRIAEAEAAGRSGEVERLKAEQLRLQSEQLDRQYQAQKQQLAIQQQMKATELERQKITAQIGVLEAEAALAKAEADGASQRELQALRQVLALRQQQVGAVDDAIASQDELNRLQEQNLNAQYSTDRERQRQSEIQFNEQQEEVKLAGEEVQQQQRRREPQHDPRTQYVGNDGLVRNRAINASTSNASRLLSGSGVPADSPIRSVGVAAQMQGITGQFQSVQVTNMGEVTSRLDSLLQQLRSVALRPNLNVSSPQPVSDAAQIYAKIQAGAANL